MELKSLYTFKKIVELGSYQNAAMALNYAQSTITFQMHQLENELGIKLFEKKGNRMVLTTEGADVLPLIENVIASAEDLLTYKGSHDRLRGTLKIALPETLLTYKMQPVLKAFREKAPEVKLHLQVLNCYSIYDQLLAGNIDIAIHYDIKDYPRSVEVVELSTYPLVMVASPRLPQSLADFITPDQHKPLSHIQNDPHALYLKILAQYLKKKRIILDAGMEVWSIEAIKQSVMSDLGVAYLPRFTVEEELKNGTLKACPMETTGELTALCAYHAGKKENPVVSLFLNVLHTEFAP